MQSDNRKIKKNRLAVRDMTLIALFTVLAIIGGKISIPVFTIPVTLQFQVCLLSGLLLGARRAMLAQGLYLLLGLIGLPVFAMGGGPAYLLQPSFGYLPGMMLCAGLVGWLSARGPGTTSLLRRLVVNLAGLVIVYVCGISWLLLIRNVYSGESMLLLRALQIGLLPFLLTDSLHALLAAMITPSLRRAIRPLRSVSA
ncbi:MAG: biotin transporter BioY [Clostridia bacterium]|nr:biotin transporter BioY [Eubacteriales bacterium]NCC47696.1 biotin transporter BioY [Clostridia bacterium]